MTFEATIEIVGDATRGFEVQLAGALEQVELAIAEVRGEFNLLRQIADEAEWVSWTLHGDPEWVGRFRLLDELLAQRVTRDEPTSGTPPEVADLVRKGGAALVRRGLSACGVVLDGRTHDAVLTVRELGAHHALCGTHEGARCSCKQRTAEARPCACNCERCSRGEHDAHCDPRPRSASASPGELKAVVNEKTTWHERFGNRWFEVVDHNEEVQAHCGRWETAQFLADSINETDLTQRRASASSDADAARPRSPEKS